MDSLHSSKESLKSSAAKADPQVESVQSVGPGRGRLVIILAGIMMSLLLAALDMTIVATALPRIVADLGGLGQISWVVTAYLIMSTTLVPIVGRVSDIYGRKPTFIVGIVIFLVGSILSGASQNMVQLIVSRGIQGGGAGFLLANTFTVIGEIFPPAERGKWQGLIGGVFGIASIAGPLLGGYLTDSLSWRWIFYVNLPVGIVALLALIAAMPSLGTRRDSRSVDYQGAAALILTLIPLLLALSLANDTYSWASLQVVGLFAFSAVMLGVFLLNQTRTSDPILPIAMFKNPIFVVIASASFLTGMGMFGSILFIPLFVQGVSGSSATNSGLVLMPMMISSVISSALAGQLISRWSHYRIIAVSGAMVMTLGMALLALIDVNTSNAQVTINIALVGAGLGVTFPLFTIVVQNAFPYGLMGLVTASVQFFRSVGGSLGVAIMGSILALRMSSNLLSRLPEDAKEALGPQHLDELQEANALINPDALSRLEEQLAGVGDGGDDALQVVLDTMKEALASSLNDVFVMAAALVSVTIVILMFLREIPLRKSHDIPVPPPSTSTPPSDDE